MLVHHKVSATYFQLVKVCQFLSTLLLLSNLQLGILTSSVPSKLNNVKNLLRYCTILSLMYCKTSTVMFHEVVLFVLLTKQWHMLVVTHLHYNTDTYEYSTVSFLLHNVSVD